MSPPGAQPAGVTGAEDRRDSAVARSPRPGSPPRLPRPPPRRPLHPGSSGPRAGPLHPCSVPGKFGPTWTLYWGGWSQGEAQWGWGVGGGPHSAAGGAELESGLRAGGGRGDERGPSCPNPGVPGVAVTCPLSGRTSCLSAGSPHLPLHSALPRASTPSGPPAQNASAHPGPVTPAPEGGPVLPTPSPQRCPGAGGLETHTGPWMSRAATDAGSGSAGTRAWGLRGRKRCCLPPGR